MYVYIHTYRIQHIYMYVDMYIYIYICICRVCMYICTCVHIYIYMFTCVILEPNEKALDLQQRSPGEPDLRPGTEDWWSAGGHPRQWEDSRPCEPWSCFHMSMRLESCPDRRGPRYPDTLFPVSIGLHT